MNEGIGFINKNMFGAQRRMHTTSRKGLGQFRNWERSASKGSLFHPAGTALKSSSAGSISVPALVIGTAQRSVNFARLAPGSYRFLVRAVNTEGVSSPQPATLEFTVTNPRISGEPESIGPVARVHPLRMACDPALSTA